MQLGEEAKEKVEKQLSGMRSVQQNRAAISDIKEKITQKERERDEIQVEIRNNDKEAKRLGGQNRMLRQHIVAKENSMLVMERRIARRQAKIDEVRHRILDKTGETQLRKEQQQYREEGRKQRAEMFRNEY